MVNSSSSVAKETGGQGSWLAIAQRVRNRRVQLGFRKGALAAHLGVSMQQFDDMEAGRVEISSLLLGRLSDVLKVPVSYFFADLLTGAEAAERCRPERGAGSDEERLQSLVAVFRKLDRDKQQYLLVLAKAMMQDVGETRAVGE
jgi:transcriptional regulator with XRE-family HTH domain